MPIRFRCYYCNQLMGISRRKAGTVVKCPKCKGEIQVPVPEGTAPADDGVDEGPIEPPGDSPGEIKAPATDPAVLSPDNASTASAASKPKSVGIFLSVGMLAISVVVVMLLLVLMFVLGLIIGRQTATPEIKDQSARPSVVTDS